MKIELIDDGYCFVCGERNPEGLRLSFIERNGMVTAEFTLTKAHQGYKEIIHGGLITAILDEAMIKAANLKGLKTITAEITVRFKNPLFTGEKAYVKAGIEKESRRLLKAKASLNKSLMIKSESLVIVAEAEAMLYVV